MTNTIALGIAENPWPALVALAMLVVAIAGVFVLEALHDPRAVRRRRMKRKAKCRAFARRHRQRRRHYA